jgi:hypothetical protein
MPRTPAQLRPKGNNLTNQSPDEDAGSEDPCRTPWRCWLGRSPDVSSRSWLTTGSGDPLLHQTTLVALHTSGPVVITVQNKVALGASQLIEDTTPTYLSTKPVPYCTRLGCRMLGTEVGNGAMLVAVCHVSGTQMFNYNLDSSESRSTRPSRFNALVQDRLARRPLRLDR